MTAPNDTGTNRKARVAPGCQTQPSVPVPRRSVRSRRMHSDPTVARARKIDRFLSRPFFVAAVFSGAPGRFVDLDDTILGVRRLGRGEFDGLPERASYMVGTIAEALEKAKSLAEE